MNPQGRLASLAAYVREGEPKVPSPCVAVCRINPNTENCEGCLRTLDEIAAWSRMGDAGKRVVWSSIEQRLAALESVKAPEAP